MTFDAPAVDVAARTEILELGDRRWADFVARHPGATPFHLPAWGRAVADCYGFRAFALASVDGADRVAAGVPVVEVRRPLGRRRWVSLPFTDHCPPLLAEGVPAPALARALRAGLDDAGVGRLQIRAGVEDAAQDAVAVRHLLTLEADPEAVRRRFHASQVQRNIRRAEREGVTVRVGAERTDLTEVFFGLHVRTRQRQGVPVQPRRFFDLIWDHVLAAGHGQVLVAEHAGVPVAAAVFLRHNGTVVYKFGASDASAWKLRPNHALFWTAIRTACESGDRAFDWGRTDYENTGLRAFKSEWGADELPLVYSTVGDAPAAEAAPLGESRAARKLAKVIQRSPEWVCTGLGRALYRYTA